MTTTDSDEPQWDFSDPDARRAGRRLLKNVDDPDTVGWDDVEYESTLGKWGKFINAAEGAGAIETPDDSESEERIEAVDLEEARDRIEAASPETHYRQNAGVTVYEQGDTTVEIGAGTPEDGEGPPDAKVVPTTERPDEEERIVARITRFGRADPEPDPTPEATTVVDASTCDAPTDPDWEADDPESDLSVTVLATDVDESSVAAVVEHGLRTDLVVGTGVDPERVADRLGEDRSETAFGVDDVDAVRGPGQADVRRAVDGLGAFEGHAHEA